MSASAEAKAREYLADAKKRLNAFSLFNKQQKYEDAAELFSKAAAQFKVAKLWHEAGEAFVQAAENSEKSNNDVEALNFYTQAAKAYKNVSSAESIRLMELVVEKQMANNKFSVAAKLYKDIATQYETDMKLDQAITAYQKAADCFQAEDSATSAQQCMLKVADYSAQREDYKRAIDIYEDVSRASVDNNLTKWSVSQYLFKAALCQLAMVTQGGDIEEVRTAVDRYKNLHAQFDGSRECQFLEKLVVAYDESDVDKFTDAVFDYDQISKLDNWKSSLLLAVKNKMRSGSALEEADSDRPVLA